LSYSFIPLAEFYRSDQITNELTMRPICEDGTMKRAEKASLMKSILVNSSSRFLSVAILPLLTVSVSNSQEYLSGPQNGFLPTGTYIVNGDITVTGLWQLEAGVVLKFQTGISFNVNSLLIANGTENDTIYFVSGEDAESWNGIDLHDGSGTSELSYCYISGSSTSGIYVSELASPEINHCVIESNYANTGGSGIHYDQCVWNMNISYTSLINNVGSGLFSSNARILHFDNCVFSNNTESGVYVTSGEVSFNHCIFESNSGSGAFAEDDGEIFLDSCIVSGNYNSGVRTGVFGRVHLVSCEVVGNSGEMGGGLNSSEEAGYIGALFSVFTENTSSTIGGAGFNSGFFHCTIYDNYAVENGSAVAYSYLYNSIVYMNMGASGVYADEYGNMFQTHSLIFNNGNHNLLTDDGSLGNINVGFYEELTQLNANADSVDFRFNLYRDPLLNNPSLDDFTLSLASPCIDAGDTLGPNSPIGLDPDGSMPDLGAFPYVSASDVTDLSTVIPFSIDLSVYPNPTNSIVNLTVKNYDYNKRMNIVLYNALGKEMRRYDRIVREGNLISLMLDDLPSGTYFIRVKQNKKMGLSKLTLTK